MDEISRDLPPDTTTRSPGESRPSATSEVAGPRKGPEELLLAERGLVRDDLVVRERAVNPRRDEPPPELAGLVQQNRLDQRSPEQPVPAQPAPEQSAPEQSAPEQSVVEPEPAVVEPTVELGIGTAELGSTAELSGTAELESTAELADASGIDAAAAVAAAAEEAEVAEIEAELAVDAELPPVPELADVDAVARTVFVLMLTSREGLSVFRLAQACNTSQQLVEQALQQLQQQWQQLGMPLELGRNGDTVKWMSDATMFPYLQRLRGVKKMERLSPAALETLAVIAYRQPVMRSEIEAIRGVKAGPMLRTLLQHKLIQTKGRAEVPGRPLQYGTTPQFLERFGLASLQELPSIREWKNLG